MAVGPIGGNHKSIIGSGDRDNRPIKTPIGKVVRLRDNIFTHVHRLCHHNQRTNHHRHHNEKMDKNREGQQVLAYPYRPFHRQHQYPHQQKTLLPNNLVEMH